MYLISYYFILFANSLYILSICWFIYGLGSALISGTLDSDIIAYLKNNNLDIKPFQVKNSYVLSTSSMLGAFIGSLLYSKIDEKIYVVSIISFFVSILISFKYYEELDNKNIHKIKFYDEIKKVLNNSKNLFKIKDFKYLFILISITPLYLQTFYQYWQVLYKEKNINIAMFGVVYFLFHMSNILGTYIYNKYSNKIIIRYLILSTLVIDILILYLIEDILFFVTFPISAVLFSIYSLWLNINFNKIINTDNISTTTSFMGSVINIVSIISIYIISYLITEYSIINTYLISYTVFFIFTFIFIKIYNKNID